MNIEQFINVSKHSTIKARAS